jgi:DNA-binding SARP family transcriptional activator
MTTTAEEGLRDDLAAALDGAARVLAVSAPAGYGKGALLRHCGSARGTVLLCDLERCAPGDDLVRPVLDALTGGDASMALASAADRLAQRRENAAAASRDALRRLWPLDGPPQLFVVRDPAGAVATPGGLDLVGELVASLPPNRTVALSTRAPLPRALQQALSAHGMVSLDAGDLALSLGALAELGAERGLSGGRIRAVHEVTRGWPLVCRLVLDLLGETRDDEFLRALSAVPHESLLDFAAHRTIAGLDEPLRNAVIVTTLLSAATHPDVVRVLGEEYDDALFARLRALPFVVRDAERLVVHPAVSALLHARFPALVKRLYERTLSVLTGEGAYVRAANVALVSGDVASAAAIIDAAPPYTAAPVPLREYERIIERIGDDDLTRFPNVWIATIPYRTFAVDRTTFVREAESVYFCLPPSAGADQRAAALMLLSSAYANVGRIADSDALVTEALDGFARTNVRVRASLLNFSASLKGIEGRFVLARSLAQEAAALSRDAFGENQTLHYIEAHEAAYRGRYDRAVAIFDELLRRRRREGLPLYLAHTATNAAFVAWVNGDDDRFRRYIDELEECLTPGLHRGFAPIVDAARGRPMRIEPGYPWPVVAAMAHLFRLGTAAAGEDVREICRAAVGAADERRDPYVQAIAHAARYCLDAAHRAAEPGLLRAVLAPVESPELHAAVEALLAGRPAGMLDRFVRARVMRENVPAGPAFVVELLGGRVTRDGEPLRLSDKEFELLALLASSHAPVTRDRIGEALWNHLDPEEWPNNVKVTLSRIRTKLGVRDCVTLVDGRYRLAPSIDVDIRRAESVLRARPSDELLPEETVRALSRTLSAFSTGAVNRFDRYTWAQGVVARLNDIACSAGIRLARDALARGAYAEALAHGRAVAEIDPFNEDACEVVLRALIGSEQVDAARREFRRYATALWRELGAEPSPRLAELTRAG